MDLLVTCPCGHQITVSEFAAGMTAPCPKCGQPLTVSPANATAISRGDQPAESVVPGTPPTPTPPVFEGGEHHQYTPIVTSPLKTHCARCGREFRGDWDRHPSSMGPVCNICSNLVTTKGQDMPSSGYVAPVDTIKLDPNIDVMPQRPVEVEEVEKTWRETYVPDNAMMQRIAIGAAVAFLLYTAWVFVSGEWRVGPAPEDIKRAATVVETAPVHELPAWATVAIIVLNTCASFVSTFTGIYIFLTLSRRLPEETFLANAIRILPSTIIIGAIFFGTSVLTGPILGTIVLLLLIVPIIFVNFGFEAQDILNFPIGLVLGAILQTMIYLSIYWFVGSIAL